MALIRKKYKFNKKTYKILIGVLIICIALLTLSFIVAAHSGNTDSQGGHYNRSTNEYHYHHGYPAHQHDDGDCPYDTSFGLVTLILGGNVLAWFASYKWGASKLIFWLVLIVTICFLIF